MNRKLLMLAASLALTLSACSKGAAENRKAANYADKIEQSEAVTADEYSEMVSFYCSAIDHALGDLRPYHEAHAAALEAGDPAKTAETERTLNQQTQKAVNCHKDVMRLGTRLFEKLHEMPDSTRHRLLNYLSELQNRYSE